MGAFVVLEGPEGGGKSSQARAMVADLAARGYSAILTREPGGTGLGDALRGVLLPAKSYPISPRAELLLYCASRAQLVEEVIRPALDGGQVVVSDRFGPSTLAYQGHGRGLDSTRLTSVVEFATGGLQPDLCILLDLPAETGLARKQSLAASGEPAEWNRFEEEELAFHQRVREGYLQMARAEPDRWFILDASLPFQPLHDRIIHEVSILLDRKQVLRRPA